MKQNHQAQNRGSPRTLLTPTNNHKIRSEIRQCTTVETKPLLQTASPRTKFDYLLGDNQVLLDQNSALLEEVTKCRENHPYLEEKLNILITENERLTSLLGKYDQLEKDNRVSKKRIAELLYKTKEQEKMLSMKDNLQARLEHTENIVCELDNQLQSKQPHSSINEALQQEVRDSAEKIMHLVQSNEQLNQILDERLAQLESMNSMVQQQQEHYESLLQKALSNNESQSQKKEIRNLSSLVQELTTQNHRFHDEKTQLMKDKLSLQDQLSVLSAKERASRTQAVKAQEQAVSIQLELAWYRDELQRVNDEHSNQWEENERNRNAVTAERTDLLASKQDIEEELNTKNYELEQMKTQLKMAEDRLAFMGEQLNNVQTSVSSTAAYSEALSNQQFSIYMSENQILKAQSQQLCQQNQQLNYQLQTMQGQLEGAQTQVLRQQQQISLQNQRFAQVQREWEAKEQMFVSETQSLIVRLQQEEKGLKNHHFHSNDISLQSSIAVDSPFKTLKLQNFYSKYDTENKEPTHNYAIL